jgi:hypothetical protein
MSIIARAPQAALLTLTTTSHGIPEPAGKPGTPLILTVPGAASLELKKLNVTATGWVQPNQSGHFQVGLLAQAYIPNTPPPGINDSVGWTYLGWGTPETIGQSGDPTRTQWMLQGQNLLYFLNRTPDPFTAQLPSAAIASGKLQGEFYCNIADSYQAPVNLINSENMSLLAGVDPVILFTLRAYLYPDSGNFDPFAQVQVSEFILTGDS